jgi:hypothetical protein
MIFTNVQKENQLNIQACIKLLFVTFVPYFFEYHIDQSISSVLFACLYYIKIPQV